jgi:hypothetical protein
MSSCAMDSSSAGHLFQSPVALPFRSQLPHNWRCTAGSLVPVRHQARDVNRVMVRETHRGRSRADDGRWFVDVPAGIHGHSDLWGLVRCAVDGLCTGYSLASHAFFRRSFRVICSSMRRCMWYTLLACSYSAVLTAACLRNLRDRGFWAAPCGSLWVIVCHTLYRHLRYTTGLLHARMQTG